MANKQDYLDFSPLVSLILAIIPITSWIFGIVTRLKEGRTIAGVVRLVLLFTAIGGLVTWILDLVTMIQHKHIFSLIEK